MGLRRRTTDRGRSAAVELLGSHVSSAGGVVNAPDRAVAISATALQLFTKTPNQWREREIGPEEAAGFRGAREAAGIGAAVSHDSYLINLASPDHDLRERSIAAFSAELKRSTALGLDGVVSHPGNYLDDREAGLIRNAAGYTAALRAVPGPVMLLVETTAGTGTVLGSRFEELRRLRDLIGEDVRDRVAFCADTCHLFAAGYDLRTDFDGVWAEWDRIIGRELLRCLHLNDSKTPLGSRRDRHELIGEGSLGPEPFRRIMREPRFASVPKILEPPGSGEDPGIARRMLDRLRRYAGGATRPKSNRPRPKARRARS